MGPGTGQAGDVTFQSFGSTTYRGRIFVLAKGGNLTIDAASDGSNADFKFDDASGLAASLLLVTQEASLTLEGQSFVNDALIEIEGAAEIAAGLRLSGDGILNLEAGGRLTVRGEVGSAQHVDFSDGTGRLTITDVAGFQGKIGLPTTSTGTAGFQLGGARIDLPNVQAQSKSFSNGVLTLHSGPNETGAVVARLNVELVFWENLSPLPPAQQDLTADDFRLAPDGSGGTLITYTPQGVQIADASLPVSVTAPTGSRVSLASILQQSFGTAALPFYSLELVPSPPLGNSPTDPPFWGQPQVRSAWFVNGQQIQGPTRVTSIDAVELLVGNNIDFPVQLQAQVTEASTGTAAGYVLYNVWTTPSAVAQSVQASRFTAGAPTPGNVIDAAMAFAAAFPGQLDDNLCNWIGDSVAAAAGATMPLPDADVDPDVNVEGGFWRIAYRGSGSNPLQNWSGLVRPGDIVRMAWFSGGGHTTTVLGAVNNDGTITVYDNADHNSLGQGIIGIHSASYWNGTNPAGTTIYRLDPDQQYLILGTALPEVIQGTVFNDLIRPGGGADTITGGPAANEIQGVTAVLNGITVTDFDRGDSLDFTDLDPARVELSFADELLTVSDGVHLARLALLGLSDPHFVVSARRQRRHARLPGGRPRRRPHGVLRRPELRLPGGRRLRGGRMAWRRPAGAAPDPDGIVPRRRQHHDHACRRPRWGPRHHRRRPRPRRPCRRRGRHDLAGRRHPQLRRRHAERAVGRRLPVHLGQRSARDRHRPGRLARLDGRARTARWPGIGARTAGQQRRRGEQLPASGRHRAGPAERRRHPHGLRRCLERGAGNLAAGRRAGARRFSGGRDVAFALRRVMRAALERNATGWEPHAVPSCRIRAQWGMRVAAGTMSSADSSWTHRALVLLS